MIDWDGRSFPLATLDGDVLPDALLHDAGVLPHLHTGLEKLFPKAKACEEAGDADPPEESQLEEYGAALGREPETVPSETNKKEEHEDCVGSTTIHGRQSQCYRNDCSR